jgi:hypothetical protein
MLSPVQVVLLGALSAPLVHAFSPVFSIPRQCESLTITWTESTIDLPVVDMPLTEVLFQLIPLDNDVSRMAPEPYTVSIPPGGHEIAALPFPAGTQFFAAAHILGSTGFTRRTVSKVFTVEHSEKIHCLPSKALPTDGRAKAKTFGKRQISVVGPSFASPTGGAPAPVNAIANPSSNGPPPAINVIGVTAIPADGSSSSAVDASTSAPASVTLSLSVPVPSSSGGVTPPIRVIGTSNIPASEAVIAPPANAAPAPSSSGAVPPIQVIGTSVVTATGDVSPPESSSTDNSSGAYETSPTATDSSSMDMATTTTSCTETPTAMPEETETSMETEMPPSTITVPYEDDSSAEDEEPCEENMDSSEHQSMHETATSEYETTTTVYLPAASETTRTANTEVVHYTAMDDMVNAANSWYKAWNPYKPAYTPSTGY